MATPLETGRVYNKHGLKTQNQCKVFNIPSFLASAQTEWACQPADSVYTHPAPVEKTTCLGTQLDCHHWGEADAGENIMTLLCCDARKGREWRR